MISARQGSNLYFYRARYYDAPLGRFLQTDPIGYADQWNLYTYVGNNPLNATDPSGEERAKTWQEAERKAIAGLRRAGHDILSTQGRGQTVYARRDGDWYFWGRKFDIISIDSHGVITLTEVKFRKDAGKQRSAARKALRRLDPTRKLVIPGKVGKIVGVARQLHFDVALKNEITLTGNPLGASSGQALSEMEGEVNIVYQFWSSEKDEKVIPISGLKRLTNPEERTRQLEELHNSIMEHTTLQ